MTSNNVVKVWECIRHNHTLTQWSSPALVCLVLLWVWSVVLCNKWTILHYHICQSTTMPITSELLVSVFLSSCDTSSWVIQFLVWRHFFIFSASLWFYVMCLLRDCAGGYQPIWTAADLWRRSHQCVHRTEYGGHGPSYIRCGRGGVQTDGPVHALFFLWCKRCFKSLQKRLG